MTHSYERGSILIVKLASYVSDEQQSAPHSSPPSTTYATTYTTSPALMTTSPREPQQRTDARQHRGSYPGSYHSTAPSPYLPPGSPAPGYSFTSPSPHMGQFPPQTQTLDSHELASAYGTSYPLSVMPEAARPPFDRTSQLTSRQVSRLVQL